MDFNASQGEAVQKFYGNRLRVRTCGLIVKEDALLLLNHNLGNGDLWLPPGGGIELGESAVASLKREIMEETNLVAKDCDFLFAFELIKQPLHALELFFRVNETEGELKVGSDFEKGAPKVISNGQFFTWVEIDRLPKENVHGIFSKISKPSEILELKGYFTL